MAQVRPEDELSAAEDGEEAEEVGPVVLEQGDISGGLHGGAEAAAGRQLTVSRTSVFSKSYVIGRRYLSFTPPDYST